MLKKNNLFIFSRILMCLCSGWFSIFQSSCQVYEQKSTTSIHASAPQITIDQQKKITDSYISSYKAEIERNPTLWLGYEQLGKAYIEKARQTGDFTYYVKSEEVLRKSLDYRPDNPRSHKYLAYALQSQHRFKEAIVQAQMAIGLNLHDGESQGILGDAYLELGKYEKAQKHYHKMFTLKKSPFNYTRLSKIQYMLGHTRSAIRSMQKAVKLAIKLKLRPESVAWCRVALGSLYFDTGKLENAEENYQEALRLYPGYFLALEHLAELRAAQKDYIASISLYEDVIKIYPQPEFYAALGDIYTILGRFADAKRYYDLAMEWCTRLINRGSQAYYRQLALFYADHEINLSEALHLALKDIDIRKDVYAYDTLAWVYLKNGKLEKAHESIMEALKFGTEDAKLFYHAGIIFHSLGNLKQAQKYLERTISLKPYFNEAELIDQTLSAIKQ